jgi:hypothetical protein
MPLLDVSGILSNPLFADTFSVIRTTQTISSGGLAQFSTQTTTGVSGVVTANTGRSLQRLADGERQADSITVHTTFLLTTGQGTTGADQIVWNGAAYTVVNVSDYSRYGAGFVCAICDFKGVNA